MVQGPTDPNRDLPAGLRVLVAEDNAINRRLCVSLLQASGHVALEAEDGDAALARLDRETVDAVLMDLQMPERNGYDTARAIRGRPGPVGRLPLIALSASGSASDYQAALAAGMDAFLLKPVNRERLLESLVRYAAQAGPNLGAPETAQPAACGAAAADRPRLDTAQLAATSADLADGEAGVLVGMLGERIDALGAALGRARDAGEPSALVRPGHKLKSACHYLGLLAASAEAKELEDAAQAGDQAAALAQGDALLAGLRSDRQQLAAALGVGERDRNG